MKKVSKEELQIELRECSIEYVPDNTDYGEIMKARNVFLDVIEWDYDDENKVCHVVYKIKPIKVDKEAVVVIREVTYTGSLGKEVITEFVWNPEEREWVKKVKETRYI